MKTRTAVIGLVAVAILIGAYELVTWWPTDAKCAQVLLDDLQSKRTQLEAEQGTASWDEATPPPTPSRWSWYNEHCYGGKAR